MARVAGKVALITGAAKGIGREAALLLAREGAALVVTDVDVEGVRQVADEIVAAGGRSLALRHDVVDEARWDEVIAAATTEFGGLDVVVNNAGIAIGGDAETLSLDSWRKVMAVNLDSVFLGTRAGIRAMKSRGGSIINISSIEGIIGDPTLAAYNASKGAVRIFTKSAALHCANNRYGIRVNSVHPGFISTPMVDGFFAESPAAVAAREATAAKHPVGHLGAPIDIAHGILFLASEESSFMTGSELVIDGGFTAQ